MKPKHVGIRELKANLSACLRQIKSGRILVITERGKPIGLLSPVEPALEEDLLEGTRSRMWAWNGRAWKPSPPKVKLRGKTMVSDLLLEDRE
jgi:antitoxin (DNA-binding transcriptional repressor) of toxin-antitoxin stability system